MRRKQIMPKKVEDSTSNLLKLLPSEATKHGGLQQAGIALLSTWHIEKNFTQEDLDKLTNKALKIYNLNPWLMAEVIETKTSANDYLSIGKEGDATFGFFEVSQGAYQKFLEIESYVTIDL